MIGGTRVLTPQMVQDKIGTSRVDLKTATRSFYDALQTLMIDYANPDTNMVINGIPVSSQDKYGVLGTLLVGKFQNDSSKAIEALLNNQTTLFNLEKQISNAAK